MKDIEDQRPEPLGEEAAVRIPLETRESEISISTEGECSVRNSRISKLSRGDSHASHFSRASSRGRFSKDNKSVRRRYVLIVGLLLAGVMITIIVLGATGAIGGGGDENEKEDEETSTMDYEEKEHSTEHPAELDEPPGSDVESISEPGGDSTEKSQKYKQASLEPMEHTERTEHSSMEPNSVEPATEMTIEASSPAED